MLLHNFIKDEMGGDDVADVTVRPVQGIRRNSEQAFPMVTDNNEVAPGGRPSNIQENNRLQGESLRRSIAIALQIHGLRRPLYSGMRYNQFGHVVFDGVWSRREVVTMALLLLI